jgi:hypothetical protein
MNEQVGEIWRIILMLNFNLFIPNRYFKVYT